jgi:hypothetical protein
MNDFDNHGSANSSDEAEHIEDRGAEELEGPDSTMLATIATVGVVGVGVAILETALLPGVLLGAAAVAAPKYAPRIGSALTPIFRSTVRGFFKASQKTREFVAEAQEHVGDIVAEMEAEETSRLSEEAAPVAKNKA